MRLGLLVLCLWALPALADSPQPQVGVLDFQVSGASPQLAGALNGVVANELQRLGVFRVMSSENIRHLIAVERRQQLLGCPNDQCVSSLTTELGFDYVLTGRVGRVSGENGAVRFTLEMTLLDPKKGQRMGSVIETAPSEVQLVDHVPQAVLKLVGKVLRGRTGELVLGSSEAGASVKVDDGLVGVTPLVGQLELAAGPHLVSVEKDGFVTWQKEVRIAPGQQVQEQAVLVPSPDFVKKYEASATRMRIGAWTSTAVAVLGIGAAAVLQVHAQKLYGSPDLPGTFAYDRAKLVSGVETEGTQNYRTAAGDLGAQIQTAQTWTYVSIGTAAVASGLAAYFWIAGNTPGRYGTVHPSMTPAVAVAPTQGGAAAAALWQF